MDYLAELKNDCLYLPEKEIVKYFSGTDILVLPYKTLKGTVELPLLVLEGLAAGCVVLSTDVGSGVTFFPFSLAKIGYQVVCTDIDPICKRDLALARKCVLHSPGTVDFRLIEGPRIPFEDSECDALYCISVLEHIPDFEKTIAEMARILKPGGLCLITCDINLQPEDGLQLDSAQYARLMSLIDRFFLRVYPERTIHPSEILTTRNSPYPLKGSTPGFARMVCRLIKQKILKPLLGRRPGRVRTAAPNVAVLGLVLRKGM